MRSLVAWLAVVGLVAACKSDTPASKELGAICATNADCDTLCLPPPDWPGGFCTHACAGDDDCPADAGCFASAQGMVCLFLCEDDRDCSFLDAGDSRWVCAPDGPTRACRGRAATN